MTYIPLKTIIENDPFSNLTMDIIASDRSELQIQYKYGHTEEFIDLSVEEAIKLRKALDDFIGDGALANEA